MKVEADGGVMKFKEVYGEHSFGLRTEEFWQLAAKLYEKATYMNSIDIIVNPGEDREKVIKVRPV